MIVVAPGRADVVEAMMGEEGPYHQLRKMYVDVCPPETLVAPMSWPSRARRVRVPGAEAVTLVLVHPHDILLAKLGRFEPKDQVHARLILAEYPLDTDALERLAADSPYRSGAIRDPDLQARFEVHLETVRRWVVSADASEEGEGS